MAFRGSRATQDLDWIIGKSGKQAIKLRSYGKFISLLIGTPSIDKAHAIRLTPALSSKIRAALEMFEDKEL